jgi:PAS domain S-box-containing protein
VINWPTWTTRPLQPLSRYIAALGLAVAAWLIRLPMESALGPQYAFLTFFPATALAAFLLGFWPGILCTIACAILADLLVIPPYYVFLLDDPEPLVALIFFVLSGAALSVIGSLARGAKNVQQALTLSEQRLSILTDATPALISYVDTDLRYRFVNAQYEKWFGVKRQAILGRTITDVLGPTTFARIQPFVIAALSGQESHFHVEIPYREGGTRWVDAHYVPEIGPSGTVTGFYVLVLDISSHKRAEATIRDREEEFRTLFELSAVGKAQTDPASGRFLRVNQRFCEIAGRTEQELLSMSFHDITHSDDRDAEAALIDPVLRGEQDRWEIEKRYLRADGQAVWVQVFGRLIRDSAGNPSRTIAAIIDISARKDAEHRLRLSEDQLAAAHATLAERQDRLQVALAASRTGTFRWNPSRGRFLEFDQNLRKLFDLRSGEPAASLENILLRLHPDDRDLFTAALHRSSQGEDFEIEFRITAQDEVRWLYGRGQTERDARGTPIGLVGACTDITHRKRVENEVRESEERFRTLANAMPQLVWTARPDGTVDCYNNRTSQFEGFRYDKDTSQWTWAPCLHSDDLQLTIDAWSAAVTSGHEYHCEHRVRMAPAEGGDYRWFLSRAVPVRDASGSVVKWFGTATDIQAIKQAEEALRRANEDLLQFASIASHDLKEPLRGMSLLASFLERDEGSTLTSQGRERLARIRSLAERLTGMVNSLLEHARTGLQPKIEPCNLTQAVQRVIDTSREDFAARGCEVVVHGTLPTVSADSVLMERVFSNLIANGLKFNESPVKRVDISAEGNTILVRDNGIGIDPRHHHTVFRIFRRIHNTEKFPGQGLGLAVAKKIVDAHGGTLEVQSSLGAGSTFRITLPAFRPPGASPADTRVLAAV